MMKALDESLVSDQLGSNSDHTGDEDRDPSKSKSTEVEISIFNFYMILNTSKWLSAFFMLGNSK